MLLFEMLELRIIWKMFGTDDVYDEAVDAARAAGHDDDAVAIAGAIARASWVVNADAEAVRDGNVSVRNARADSKICRPTLDLNDLGPLARDFNDDPGPLRQFTHHCTSQT
jgi:hypothetical protein